MDQYGRKGGAAAFVDDEDLSGGQAQVDAFADQTSGSWSTVEARRSYLFITSLTVILTTLRNARKLVNQPFA